jgi:hypothetical protein
VIGAAFAALAVSGRWSYLNVMAPLLSTPQETVSVSPSSGGMRLVVAWGGAGLGVIALCGALALWFHYGATVFFEMIASGISACF